MMIIVLHSAVIEKIGPFLGSFFQILDPSITPGAAQGA